MTYKRVIPALALLLLALPCWGQEKAIQHDTTEGRSGNITTGPWVETRIWFLNMQDLVSLWREYKAWCYADSVTKDLCHQDDLMFGGYDPEKHKECTDSTHVWYGGRGTYLVLVRSEEPRFSWQHKLPTFSGFMDWLEKTK